MIKTTFSILALDLMMLGLVVMVSANTVNSSVPPSQIIRKQDFVNSDTCKAFNNWRTAVVKNYQEIMNDEVPYLSWDVFVMQRAAEEKVKEYRGLCLYQIETDFGDYDD